jgi:hypothetical protein
METKKPRKSIERITVIINNRDLLDWPSAMCEHISRLTGLEEIIILDNGSSNRDLLQWYKLCPYKVIFLENLGHRAPWDSGILEHLKTDLYVVTDPDLDLSSLPNDTLLHLSELLEKYPTAGKVGLSLRTDCVQPTSPYFEHVRNYESKIQGEVINGEFFDAAIDTTFALYDRRCLSTYNVCGIRTVSPYVARHIPWEVENPEGDFRYYLENCNSSSSYKIFTNYRKDEGSLANLYSEYTFGKVSTKWESYFPIYDFWLSPTRDTTQNILEIGVQNGGSLEIQSRYFRKARAIIGADVNPLVNNLCFQDPRIKIIVGAAREKSTFQKILESAPNGYDLIIDDGSHHSIDTVLNFVMYFPLLNPGGLYIVEDMHCAYWEDYGGGLENPRSVAIFFKSIIDLINVEHARGKFNQCSLFKEFFDEAQLPTCLRDGSIFSIASYNSIYVIKKSTDRLKPFLGGCVIVGDEASVDDRVLAHRKYYETCN